MSGNGTSRISPSAVDFDRRVIEVEDDLRVVFRPHDGQKKVLFNLLYKMMTLVFLQCGRKFGKTDVVIYCLYWFAMVFDGCEVYYIADTMKHAGELVWLNRRLPDFLKRARRYKGETKKDFENRKREAQKVYDKWILKTSDSKLKVYLKNKSVISVDGAENYANADGIEPQFLAYDEFRHHDRRYNEAMEPNLDVYNGSMLVIGTPPPSTDNYYCEVAADARRREDGAFIKCPAFLNTYMYPEGEKDTKFQKIVKKYMDRGDEDILMREYYGEIVAGGNNAIFPMFKSRPEDEFGNFCGYSEHVLEHSVIMKDILEHPEDWDFYCSFDPGSAVCFAVLFAAIHRRTNAIAFVDEIYETSTHKTSTRQIFPMAMRKMLAINPDIDSWNIIYDNAALWFFTEVQVEYNIAMMPCSKDLKNKESKLGQIKDVMLAGLFYTSEKCVNFHKEITNYIKDDKGRIPNKNDHLIDDMRYIFSGASYDFTLLPEIPKIDDEMLIPVPAHIDFMKYMEENDSGIGYEEILREFYE